MTVNVRERDVNAVEDMIRTDWFKDHEITVHKEKHSTTIYWKKKGTGAYAVKYVFSGYNIFISGDIGDAVYTLTCPATLENIKDFNLYYLSTKLRALDGPFYDFDNKEAIKQIDKYWSETKEERDPFLDPTIDKAKEHYNELTELIGEIGTYDEWVNRFYDFYQGVDEDDWYLDTEYVVTFGRKASANIIAFSIGLNMIIDQLNIT